MRNGNCGNHPNRHEIETQAEDDETDLNRFATREEIYLVFFRKFASMENYCRPTYEKRQGHVSAPSYRRGWEKIFKNQNKYI